MFAYSLPTKIQKEKNLSAEKAKPRLKRMDIRKIK